MYDLPYAVCHSAPCIKSPRWRCLRCRVGRGRARPQGLTLSQTMGPREHLPTPYPYAHASIFRSPLAYASGALTINPDPKTLGPTVSLL